VRALARRVVLLLKDRFGHDGLYTLRAVDHLSHDEILGSRESPPWLRRGGRDIKKMQRSLLTRSRTGGSISLR
jgi:hypothetical protein